MTEQTDFWKAQPKPPARDLRMYSLLIPACASALGFFAFSVLAFGFVELDALSANFRTVLVLIGAFSLAFGGEVGTLTAVVEIFRKNGQAQRWDWIGLVVSVCSTLSAFVLAFAALLGVQATWGATVKMYGPIVLGVLSALDAYAGFMEVGLYLSQYDARMEDWVATRERSAKRDFDADRRASRAEPATDSHEPAATRREPAPSAPPRRATRDEWRAIYPQLNGSRARLDADGVNTALVAHGFAELPASTARDWAKEARESAEAHE